MSNSDNNDSREGRDRENAEARDAREDGEIESQGAREYRERRRKADWVTKMATIMSLVSWVIAFTVWMVLDRASPEKESMFSRYFDISVRDYWNSSLLPIAFALLILSLCICVSAFVFNMLRMKRKTDKYKKSIIIIGCITIIGIVFFLVQFGFPW